MIAKRFSSAAMCYGKRYGKVAIRKLIALEKNEIPLTLEDLECYLVNYDETAWQNIEKKEGDLCVPIGAVSAIRRLIQDIVRRINNSEIVEG